MSSAAGKVRADSVPVVGADGREVGHVFQKVDGKWHAVQGGYSLAGQCDFPTSAAAVAAVKAAASGGAAVASAQPAPAAAGRPAARPVAPLAAPIAAAPVDPAAAEWANSPGLRSEFPTAAAYCAFVKAAAVGNVAGVGDGWEREWRGKPALQCEFVSAASYAALRRHEARKGKR